MRALFVAFALLSGFNTVVLLLGQEQIPPTEKTMPDKDWYVACALPGQPIKEWQVRMSQPICHRGGFWIVNYEGKELLLPVGLTYIEER